MRRKWDPLSAPSWAQVSAAFPLAALDARAAMPAMQLANKKAKTPLHTLKRSKTYQNAIEYIETYQSTIKHTKTYEHRSP